MASVERIGRTPPSSAGSSTLGRLARTVGPWLLAGALLAIAVGRTRPEALRRAFAGAAPATGPMLALVVAAVLVTDGLAVARALAVVGADVDARTLLRGRAAACLPQTLSVHAGAAYLAYWLARHALVRPRHVVLATVLGYGASATSLAALVVWAGVVDPRFRLPALAVGAAGAAGAALVFVPFVRRLPGARDVLDVGPHGLLRVFAARLPHTALIVAGTWVAYACFGVVVPPVAALVLLPALVAVSSLPIAPQGLGVRETVASGLLAAYAPGGDGPARILAASAALGLTAIVVQGLVGLAAFAWEARRGAPC